MDKSDDPTIAELMEIAERLDGACYLMRLSINFIENGEGNGMAQLSAVLDALQEVAPRVENVLGAISHNDLTIDS